MAKDTSKIVEELKLCADFKSFYEENREHMITDSLSRMLTRLTREKGLKKSEIIKRSDMSEVYVHQIFSGRRKPERNKLLALAVGMGLTADEIQSLLKCAGYPPLYVKRPFDSIVMYGVCKALSVMEINGLLFENDLETLG